MLLSYQYSLNLSHSEMDLWSGEKIDNLEKDTGILFL